MSRASDRDRAFGLRVADVREFYGMSQTDLARRTTVKHQVTLARIEHGERPATIGEAQSIAAALGVPLGELLDNDVPMPVKCPECIQTRQRVLAAIGIRSSDDYVSFERTRDEEAPDDVGFDFTRAEVAAILRGIADVLLEIANQPATETESEA